MRGGTLTQTFEEWCKDTKFVVSVPPGIELIGRAIASDHDIIKIDREVLNKVCWFLYCYEAPEIDEAS